MISVAGVGIGYVVSIVIARVLGPVHYERFAVTVATLGLLATIAESGVGKYALKVVPGYTVSEQWSLNSGYWRFSLGTTLTVSLLLAAIIAIRETLSVNSFGHYPLGIAVVFLPAVALAGVGVDFVMASRAAITGTVIARLIIPGTTLLALAIAAYVRTEITSRTAIVCFGIGSAAGTLLCAAVFRRTADAALFSTKPEYQFGEWVRECASFAAISFLMTWTLRVSLVVMGTLKIPSLQVAYFAAAVETGCLILLLAKSTDKLFEPEMSAILYQRNWVAGRSLRSRRFVLVGSGCGVFLLTMMLFGRQVLGLYGDEFRAGYPALCLVTVGACALTLCSLAPAYLRFVGQNRFVIGVILTGAFLVAILTAILGLRYGATNGT